MPETPSTCRPAVDGRGRRHGARRLPLDLPRVGRHPARPRRPGRRPDRPGRAGRRRARPSVPVGGVEARRRRRAAGGAALDPAAPLLALASRSPARPGPRRRGGRRAGGALPATADRRGAGTRGPPVALTAVDGAAPAAPAPAPGADGRHRHRARARSTSTPPARSCRRPTTRLAGWYRPGPAPGDAGPAVLTGHVDSAAGPAVFFRLRDVAVGDAVLGHPRRRDDGAVHRHPGRPLPQGRLPDRGGLRPDTGRASCG